MRRIGLTYFIIFLGWSVHGQIIKKETAKPVVSTLDKIFVSEHFSSDDLAYVFSILYDHYGIKIKFDSADVKGYIFSYWFTGTPMSRALEIILRDKPLTYSFDGTAVVRINKNEPINGEQGDNNGSFAVSEIKPRHPSEPKRFKFALSGKVVDRNTGEPLPSAVVKIKNSTSGTVTNADGFYTLESVPTDTTTLLASYLGYESREIYLTPETDIRFFKIEILPETHILQQAVIVGTRDGVMKMSGEKISTIKLSPQKLMELPNVGERDIMRAFQLMPGVSAANESSSGLYVRGGTPDQNLVLYDGFTIYQVDHLYGFFSAFNANALKEVQLYKGGFEAKYGGRLSSVTDITGKDGNQKNFNMGGDISLLSVNAFMEVPITDNITLLAAGRKSWRGPIYNWIFDNFNKTNNSSDNSSGPKIPGSESVKAKSSFYDANAKLTWHPTKKDAISLSYFSGRDNLDNGFNINTPSFLQSQGISLDFGTTDLTKYGNIGTGLKWSRKWSNTWYTNTNLSYSNYYSQRDRSTNGTITTSSGGANSIKNGISEDNNLKDFSYKTDVEWLSLKHNAIGFGLFGTRYDIKYSYSQNDTTSVLDRHNLGQINGVYLQDRITLLKEKLELAPGIRMTQYDVTGQTYHEPRLSLQYRLTRNLTLKGAWGEYYQFANRITREDILSGSKDFWILSDGKKVPVSQAIHYITGMSFEDNDILFSVEGYYKTLDNISQYSLRYNASMQGINYDEHFYLGNGFTKGIEFLAQKKSGKLTGWASYTLARTMYHFDVYSKSDFAADHDVRNEFKIAGIYKYKKWDFSATWVYASGKPYTAPAGAYSVKLVDGSSETYFTVTEKNGLRLPDYHRLDLSANYHLYNESGKDVGYIGLSVFNAYARNNVWYKQYSVVEQQVVETNVSYLGLIPNLTLSLKLH